MNDLGPSGLDPRTAAGLPDRATAGAAGRLVRRLALGAGAAVIALTAAQILARVAPSLRLPGAFTGAPFASLPLAALLTALAGLAGTWAMARARCSGDPARAARWPQVWLVVPPALATAAALLAGPGAAPDTLPVATHAAWLWGGAFIILAFPVLVSERVLAAWSPERLPEAPALRALLFLATIALPAAGVLAIAAGLGAPILAGRVAAALSLLPCAIAAELALRAVGRCFLPPPPAGEARAVGSVLARLLAEGARTGNLAAPVRRHLGIDFARSWALAYARAAIPPLALVLALLCWGLTGVALVGLDQRAIYERFGAPVSVLPPGLHLVLPWPLGRTRPVEFGTVHELGLTGETASERVGAEDPPPRSADRLWERTHPNEAWFLIPAARDGRQSFHMVNADIRLFWRIGLGDADAQRATYRVADPPALLRQAAGRVMAAFFAGRTLDAVLGENREAMVGRLRGLLQQDLDDAGSGLDLTAVVITAIHPPGGAADAYHAVQAAQINAEASIIAERGRAQATLAAARQDAIALETDAAATAAELTGTARADATRFAADRDAAAAAGEAFRFERRLGKMVSIIPKTEVIVIDHRIHAADGPMIDLRPPPGDPADSVIGKP